MEFEKMSVDEIIEYLFKEQNHISTTDLSNALDACSIVDTCAGPNALTIFYSGGEDQIINTIADTANPNVRLIRRTDAFKLLSSSNDTGDINFDQLVYDALKAENPLLTKNELDSLKNQKMYGVSHYSYIVYNMIKAFGTFFIAAVYTIDKRYL